MKAIISDIHGNLEAFQAVIDDIDAKGIQEIYCLGDIVGYGPNPLECLELVEKRCSVILLGNHDEAVYKPPVDFNVRAKRAIDWTREQIQGHTQKNWIDFLKERSPVLNEGRDFFCHASPRQPLREYMFPRVCQNHKIMKENFSKFQQYCFVGHTHIPGIFTHNFQFHAPEEVMNIFMMEEEKVLLNIGSVGQPRDRDYRACYITYDGDTVVYRRIDYDIAKCMSKIRSTPALDNFLADRLREGK